METFKLTTYNIHGFPWSNPAIQEIVAWLVSHSDIVAIQEIWCRHNDWSAAFAAHGWIFARPARENHIAAVFGSGLAIAWRANRWRLTDSRFYPFLDSTSLDQFVTKGWFRIELQEITAPTNILRIINTHMQSDYDFFAREFHHITEAVRRNQIAQLVAVEQQALPQLPTLVTGDMNTDYCWFPAGKWLLPDGMAVSPITFPLESQRLDHCVPIGPTRWNVEDFCVSPLNLSDHYPVTWSIRPITSSQSLSRSAEVSEARTLEEQAASQTQHPLRRSPPRV